MSKILRLPTNWLLVGVIAIGGLAALLGVASQAIWTSTATVPSNQFTTGSVTIGTTPTSTLLSLTLAKPGDTDPAGVPGAQLQVQNTGTLNFIYDVTVAVTACAGTCAPSPLESELKLEIKGVDVDPTVPCDAFDGAVIYALGNVVPASGNLFLDRALSASTNEYLCFKVTLPTAATNAAQGQDITVEFTFFAEQA